MQNKFKGKEHDYQKIPPGYWINILGNLESRDYRMRADREDQKSAANNNKKKAEQSWYSDSNSKVIPRVPQKNKKTKPGKDR